MTLFAQGVWGLERWPREEAVSQVWGRGEGQCVSSILAPMVLVTPGRMRFRVLLWALGSEQKCLYLRGKGQETAVDTLSSDRASCGCPELLVQLTEHTNSKHNKHKTLSALSCCPPWCFSPSETNTYLLRVTNMKKTLFCLHRPQRK